jgi:hypothetical protein
VSKRESENYISRVTQIYSNEPTGEEILEFRLLYWGEVLASSNAKRRSAEKHAMRKQFHPQLRRLWNTRRTLRGMVTAIGMGGEVIAQGTEAIVPRTGSWLGLGFEKMADSRPFNGFRFIPLVTETQHVRCSIEILFLRHEDTGNLIFQGGDIDGRVKTIFDALRLPKVGELDADDKPDSDEDPFFVLLEDDKLISQVSVSTEQLLLLPGKNAISPNDAFLQMRVELTPTAMPSEGYIFQVR